MYLDQLSSFSSSISLPLSVLLIAFAESLAFAGLLIPGIALLFIAATAAAQQGVTLELILIYAAIGACLGDGVSFFLGRYYGPQIRSISAIAKKRAWLEKGEQFFNRYGLLSLFISRFIGPLRPLVPFIAGTFHVPTKPYLLINLMASCLWAPLYILPGYAAGLTLDMFDINWSLAIEVCLILFLTLWGFSYSHRVLNSRFPESTVATSAMLCGSAILFFSLITIQLSGAMEKQNEMLFRYLSISETNPAGLAVAETVTYLGDALYICLATLAVLCWCWLKKTLSLGWAFVFFIISGATFNKVLKILFAIPRPETGQHLTSYSFPSGHSSAASTFFCCLAVIIASGAKPSLRRWIYIGFAVPAAFVAVSRTLLGLHWPLDVLTGFIEGILIAAGFKFWIILNKPKPDLSLNEKSQLLAGLFCISVGYVVINAWFF